MRSVLSFVLRPQSVTQSLPSPPPAGTARVGGDPASRIDLLEFYVLLPLQEPFVPPLQLGALMSGSLYGLVGGEGGGDEKQIC